MRDLRRILVPTDFSDTARSALEMALLIAGKGSAHVDVVYVWEPSTTIPLETMLGEVGMGRPSTIGEIARKEATRRMAQFLATVGHTSGSLGSRIEVGRPDELITTLAEQGSYDLIVMGTHGRRGLLRAVLGSVAERVVRHAPCPVLTIPARSGDST
jgi:nucleotide-binding universal stress UspA family protein